jgi:chitinase
MQPRPLRLQRPSLVLAAMLLVTLVSACGGDDNAACDTPGSCRTTGGSGGHAGSVGSGGTSSGSGGDSTGGASGSGDGGSSATGGGSTSDDGGVGGATDIDAGAGGSLGTGGSPPTDGAPGPRRIVAYVATWLGGLGEWVDFTHVTHLNIAFANPQGGDSPSLPGDIAAVVSKAHASGSHVLISIGGDGGSPEVATHYTPGNVNAFVDAISSYLDAHDLDGVDVDIEGDVVGNGDYGPFVQKLKAKLHPKGKLVTAALAPWFLDPIQDATLQEFDFINVMSYDDKDNTTEPGEHAPYTLAVSDLGVFTQRHVPPDRLVLGVPFYGYCWGNCDGYLSYDAILGQYPTAWQKDWIDEGGAKVSYNGQPTIAKKCQLAKSYGGIMIWEASEDADGAHSLFKTIVDTL